MPSKSSRIWSYVDTKVYTKVRKTCTADDADTPYEHSLRHYETIDILITA